MPIKLEQLQVIEEQDRGPVPSSSMYQRSATARLTILEAQHGATIQTGEPERESRKSAK